MSALTFIVPFRRVSPVYIPRRDMVLSVRDSLTLTVCVVERDDPTSPSLDLSGGLGGPTLTMVIWDDRGSWASDYGMSPSAAVGSVLWAGAGVADDDLPGTFLVFVPTSTLVDFPARCGFSLRLDYDGALQSAMLAQGTLHITPAFGPAAASTAEGITTDALDPITTD